MEERFEQQATTLGFNNEGIIGRILRELTIERAIGTDRTHLLTLQKRDTGDNKVRYITNYNSQWRNIQGIFDQFWPILTTDPDFVATYHLKHRQQLRDQKH